VPPNNLPVTVISIFIKKGINGKSERVFPNSNNNSTFACCWSEIKTKTFMLPVPTPIQRSPLHLEKEVW
jgi:hypothetical protein